MKFNVQPGPRLAYTLEEACKMTTLGLNTLRRRIRKGELKTTRIGRRVLVTAKELERFISEGTK